MDMMKTTIIFFVSMIVFCRPGTAGDVVDDWATVIQKNDITVYARVHPDTDVREYRAKAIFDENILSLSAVLDDIPAAVEWFPFCRFAGLIEENSDGRKIIINVADLPWPFQDRYAVFGSRKTGDAARKQIIIDFEVDEESLSREVDSLVDADAMVRVAFMKGQWTLAMIDADKTEVTYTVCADAGGHIPGWLITTFFDDTPYKTLENMRQFVKQSRYQRYRLTDQVPGFAHSQASPADSGFPGR